MVYPEDRQVPQEYQVNQFDYGAQANHLYECPYFTTVKMRPSVDDGMNYQEMSYWPERIPMMVMDRYNTPKFTIILSADS